MNLYEYNFKIKVRKKTNVIFTSSVMPLEDAKVAENPIRQFGFNDVHAQTFSDRVSGSSRLTIST